MNQQFEPNIIEPRGKVLDMPDNYTIETVNPDTIDERNEHFTDELNDPTAQDDILDVVEGSTKEGGLLQLGQDARDLQDSDDEPAAGYKRTVLGALNELVDKILQRSARSRIQTVRAIEADKPKARKTRKPRTNYTLANMLIVSVKALTAAIATLEELGIIEPKLYKELQTLPEAAQQLKAIYREIRIQNNKATYRNVLRNSIGNNRVLRSRQVFRVKRGPNGTFLRFKARQVVRRYS